MNENSIVSNYDGKAVYYTEISAENPRFCVQICHGMCEHRKRYYAFMEYLASQGGACIIHDMRGHGETAAGKFGVFSKNGEEAVLADVTQIGEILREKYPSLPFFLVGHSMGSLVARVWTAYHDDCLGGLLLAGEVSPVRFVGFGVSLMRIAVLFGGTECHWKIFDRQSEVRYNKGFLPEEGEENRSLWVSANREDRLKIRTDPYCGFHFACSGYLTLFRFLRDTYDPKIWEVQNRWLPVLMLSGEQDPITGSEKAFRKSLRFMQDMGYKNVEGKRFADMRHEILQGSDCEAVWEDCKEFFLAER